MKKISRFIPSLLIALAIVVLGLCLKGGFDNIAFKDRYVGVRGLAERQVKATTASWNLSYTLTGDDLSSLYEQVEGKNKIVIDFLKSAGIPESDITAQTPTIYDPTTNRYTTERPDYRYSITVTVSVSSDKVDAVYAMTQKQGELLTKGVPYSETMVNYSFTQLNSIKPEMVAEATKNAREVADRFAADSQSAVGKIKSATQGQFSIEDVESAKPYYKNVRIVTYVDYYLED